jgi:hypothetical protein
MGFSRVRIRYTGQRWFMLNILDPKRFAMLCSGSLRPGFLIILLVVAWIGALAPGLAIAATKHADVFTIGGVAVNISAKTGKTARTLAITTGERAAFQRLLERLVPKRDHYRLPNLSDEAIRDLVRGFEVEEEYPSARRYVATLTIRFKAEAVRQLFREAGVPFAETRSKPLVVLPVLRVGGELRLWNNPNPWREAWAQRGRGGGLVPLIVPLGDLSDVTLITAEQALQGKAEPLRRIAQRYGASDALVALASVEEDSGRLQRVMFNISRYGTAATEQSFADSVTGTAGETSETLLRFAANEAVKRMEEIWKLGNMLHFDKERDIAVVIPLSSLAGWLEVRKRLAGVSYIRETRLISLSRSEAHLLLRYLGDEPQLINTLAQSDLILAQEGARWLLRLDERAAAGNSLVLPPGTPNFIL